MMSGYLVGVACLVAGVRGRPGLCHRAARVFFFLLIIGVVREGGCSDGCGVVDVRCIIRRNDMQSFRSIYGEKMVFWGGRSMCTGLVGL